MAQQQPTAATPAQTKPVGHKHTNPDTNYQHTCKACRAADAERSKPETHSVSEDDLERTTFLIPESPYDNAVCRAYLSAKYPDAQYIGNSLDLQKVAGWPDSEQIVVVRRDTWPKTPGKGFRKEKDEMGKWIDIPIEPETYISEVVESAPVLLRDAREVTKADRFTKSQTNMAVLLRRLAELMAPPYRIDLPRDENDTVLNFVYA